MPCIWDSVTVLWAPKSVGLSSSLVVHLEHIAHLIGSGQLHSQLLLCLVAVPLSWHLWYAGVSTGCTFTNGLLASLPSGTLTLPHTVHPAVFTTAKAIPSLVASPCFCGTHLSYSPCLLHTFKASASLPGSKFSCQHSVQP